MGHMLPTELAVLVELQLVGRLLFVLRRGVIPALALSASQGDNVSHIASPISAAGLHVNCEHSA